MIPFNLLVDMAFNEDIRHVIPDKALDLFKDIGNKALLVFRWKWLQLFSIQTEATDFIESVLEPLDGFPGLAELDVQAIQLGWV